MWEKLVCESDEIFIHITTEISAMKFFRNTEGTDMPTKLMKIMPHRTKQLNGLERS